MRILDKTSIAIGIEWTLHESLAQAKRAIAGKKKILVARKVISGECVQGFCAASAKGGKLQAGALLVAAAANDALVYHALGDGNAWVCAIREGIPLHGFDVVADEETAKTTLAEVMSYVPSADIYGDIPGARGSLGELLSHLSAKDKKAATLGKPESIATVVLLMLAILALAGAAYFGFTHFRNLSSLADSSSLQMRNEEELRKAKADFEAEVATKRATFWHSRALLPQFSLWFEVLHRLPVSANGWVPSALNCDLNSCQVGWKRDPLALPSDVAKLPGKGADTAFNPLRNDATTSFALGTLDPMPHAQGPTDIDRYLVDLRVRVPTIALTVEANRTSLTVIPPKDVPGLVAVMLGQEGGWKAVSSNVAALPALLEKLEQPGVTLTRLKIANLTLSRPYYQIDLEGRYRVGN